VSINSTIRTAITPIVAVCVPDVYEGTEKEYCTFNWSTWPAEFIDNKATEIGYSVQIHWFAPTGINPISKLKQMCAAVETAGMSYPSVVNASDGDGQHYVIETTWHEGVA
jgi:hypothetical protein